MKSVLVLSFVIYITSCKLLQVQFISRHCDRTNCNPAELKNYGSKTDITKILKIPVGDLTPLGMKQCSMLGEFVKGKYLNESSPDKISGIETFYKSTDYTFHSTDSSRAIVSGFSIGIGLFERNQGLKIDVGEWKGEFPYGENSPQAIPYVTEAKKETILMGPHNCKKVADYRYLIWPKEPQVIEYYKTHKKLFKKVEELTGNSINSCTDFLRAFDLILVLHYHELLPEPLEEIFDDMFLAYSDLFEMRNGRSSVGNLGGGRLVEKIYNNMKKFIENRRQIVVPDVTKLIHYSAHDTSIAAIVAALNLGNKPEDEFLKRPSPYGSAFFFELHEIDNEHFIKIGFKNGWNGEYVNLKIPGCEELCEISDYYQYIEEVSIPKNWCKDCQNTDVEICMKETIEELQSDVTSYKILLVGSVIAFSCFMLVALSVLFILFIFCTQEKRFTQYQPINSK